MSKRANSLRAALSAVLALGITGGAGVALADHEGEEQCAGIIKAGQNDCATSRNACHGHVTVDADSEAWIYLPKGTCEKLAGARVVQVVDPTPPGKSGR
jgi:uncharacterized membrane protein